MRLPRVGWALGDGKERGEDPAWDGLEADSLYTLLEKEIIPEHPEAMVPLENPAIRWQR